VSIYAIVIQIAK